MADWEQCPGHGGNGSRWKQNGGIDILCANAGVYPQTNMADMDPSEWDLVLGTNLKGNFLSVKACLPHGSSNPEQGRVDPDVFHHRAGHRLSRLGALWRVEGRSTGLHAVPPASNWPRTASPSTPSCPATSSPKGWKAWATTTCKTMATSIPLKKLGRVEDIGNAALFLASREANYITGQTIIVDGGQILPESLEAIEQA